VEREARAREEATGVWATRVVPLHHQRSIVRAVPAMAVMAVVVVLVAEAAPEEQEGLVAQ
jgi:hypothetical protein